MGFRERNAVFPRRSAPLVPFRQRPLRWSIKSFSGDTMPFRCLLRPWCFWGVSFGHEAAFLSWVMRDPSPYIRVWYETAFRVLLQPCFQSVKPLLPHSHTAPLPEKKTSCRKPDANRAKGHTYTHARTRRALLTHNQAKSLCCTTTVLTTVAAKAPQQSPLNHLHQSISSQPSAPGGAPIYSRGEDTKYYCWSAVGEATPPILPGFARTYV